MPSNVPYRDPAMVVSNFERIGGDRYFTQPLVTSALLRRLVLPENGLTWEPAAGRGDICKVLADNGERVLASDINLSEFDPGICEAREMNFLTDDLDWTTLDEVTAVVTNPPYKTGEGDDEATTESFIRRALDLRVEVVAMLVRTEFRSAATRADLFTKEPFAFEVVLTFRPRWDWWLEPDPERKNSSPRHNFSWLVWDRRWQGSCTTFWEGKKANG